ncbi:MAG: phage holin family protein [Actinomycetes bacterium]
MAPRSKPLPQQGLELKELVVAYFKQETTDELKGLAGYVAFGLAAWLLIGIGVVCAAVGLLRLLQENMASVFDGNWSWVPYLIVVLILGICGYITWKVTTRRREGRSQ